MVRDLTQKLWRSIFLEFPIINSLLNNLDKKVEAAFHKRFLIEQAVRTKEVIVGFCMLKGSVNYQQIASLDWGGRLYWVCTPCETGVLNGIYHIIVMWIRNRLRKWCRELVLIISSYIREVMNALWSLRCKERKSSKVFKVLKSKWHGGNLHHYSRR